MGLGRVYPIRTARQHLLLLNAAHQRATRPQYRTVRGTHEYTRGRSDTNELPLPPPPQACDLALSQAQQGMSALSFPRGSSPGAARAVCTSNKAGCPRPRMGKAARVAHGRDHVLHRGGCSACSGIRASKALLYAGVRSTRPASIACCSPNNAAHQVPHHDGAVAVRGCCGLTAVQCVVVQSTRLVRTARC